jgi:hypothetical protein
MIDSGRIPCIAWISISLSCFVGCSLFGTEADTTSPPNTVSPELMRHVAQEVEKYRVQVETLRELPFQRKVHSAVVTREQYQEETAKEIDAGISDSLSQEISLQLSQFGFFPDTSLRYKDLFKSFSGGFAVGYYRQGSDSVFVLSDYAYDETNLREILTHELVHALQDQYGRLDRIALPDSQLSPYRYDAAWYHTCLVEGEAHFVNALAAATYIYPQPDPKANALLAERNIRANAFRFWKMAAKPQNLFLPSRAAYEFGPALIAEAYDLKGWDSVETLYANAFRPSFSAITGQHAPWIVTDLEPYLNWLDTTDAYWDLGSHGSIGLLSLINQEMDSTDFYTGLHWRGDTYFYSHKPGHAWGQLVWTGVFEDSVFAHRATTHLSTMLRKRFQGGNYPNVAQASDTLLGQESGYLFQGMGLSTYLIQSGNRIFWIEGFSDTDARQAFAFLKADPIDANPMRRAGTKKVRNEMETVLIPARGRIYQDLLSLRP